MNQDFNTIAPSLVAPEAKGGDDAEGGFAYQDSLIVARIPRWLSHDGFTEMIREALGDAEAKFFVPGVGEIREFVEYKNHDVLPKEFWSEIKRFREMDQAASGAYHNFVLVCNGISKSLQPMEAALRRVRDAFPFYDGVKPVQESSYRDFAASVVKQKQLEETAEFIFTKVQLETNTKDSDDLGQELFQKFLQQHYPQLEETTGKSIKDAYASLGALVKSRKNKPIRRRELEEAIWEKIPLELQPKPVIRMHTDNELKGSNDGFSERLEFEWGLFSGGGQRSYPPPEDWNKVMVKDLVQTRDWIIANNRKRHILLTGQRRLSASLAIGSVFSAVSGFRIDLDYRDDIWSTTAHAAADTPDYPWKNRLTDGGSENELVIALGISKGIASEVDRFLENEGLAFPKLHLWSEIPITSPQHCNKAVDGAKKLILNALAQTDARKIHLFIAAPAHFVLFLGHRLNATCAVQCYERTDPNAYIPTCLLGTN